MKALNMLKVISCAVILASFGNVFAAGSITSCPGISDVRNKGSNFSFAKLDDASVWDLISQPFEYDDQNWQTTFSINLGVVVEPKDAIEIGSERFKNTPFASQPAEAKFGNKTVCSYTVKGSPYSLMVSSPVEYGLI